MEATVTIPPAAFEDLALQVAKHVLARLDVDELAEALIASRERLLSVREAAVRLGVSQRTLQDKLAGSDPEIPSVLIGSRRLIEQNALAAWLDRQRDTG